MKRGESGKRQTRSTTFREQVGRVQQEIDPLARFSHMRPGEFDGDEMEVLRHPSGDLLHLAEWNISLDDARKCVKAGADVYLNPGDYPWLVEGTIHSREEQRWLIGAEAGALDHAEPITGKNSAPIRISLYKADSGRIAIHLVGNFSWNLR
ncbi:hypothetical protein [Brachybacterium sp. UNK5269]|uniref:hypothetical protein n=1 Tax=Brachybacterium sp. UNK5269 TaxID=3408576 RepID=UPI003BB020C1